MANQLSGNNLGITHWNKCNYNAYSWFTWSPWSRVTYCAGNIHITFFGNNFWYNLGTEKKMYRIQFFIVFFKIKILSTDIILRGGGKCTIFPPSPICSVPRFVPICFFRPKRGVPIGRKLVILPLQILQGFLAYLHLSLCS